MTFTFNPNIPNAPNDPGDDQPIMQSNNASINSIIPVNHVGFNTPNGGYHTLLNFNANVSTPGIALGVATFYPFFSGGVTKPYWQNAAQNYELVGGILTQLANPGYFRLSNGLMFQWGTATVTSGNGSYNFPTGFPTNCFTVVQTPIRNSSNVDIVYVVNFNQTGVNYRNTSSGITQVTFIAIGN
jgi:hypothetical protein